MANWNIKKKNGDNVIFSDNSVNTRTENRSNNSAPESNFFNNSFTSTSTNSVFMDDQLIYEDRGYNNQPNKVVTNRIPELLKEERKANNRIIIALFVLAFFFAPPMFILMVTMQFLILISYQSKLVERSLSQHLVRRNLRLLVDSQ